jgi:purine nucleosidase
MSRSVIHDQDGHVDDLLSSLLLWLSPDVDLQAVTITDGDCYAQQAFEAMIKMATFLDLDGAEVGMSEDQPSHPFPENWRRESFVINELPIFSENALKKPHQSGRPRKSQALITDILQHSKNQVTLIATGPLTNIAPVFQERPDLVGRVEECIMMAGAFNVDGNVDQPEHDGSAEWNLYADPAAARSLLESGIPMTFIPLDVTNQVPVTPQFFERLERQSDCYRASNLASKVYSLVRGFNYFFWDTLTVAAVMKPDLFTFKEARVDIATTGKNAGKTTTAFFGGRKAKIATSFDKDGFEELFLSTLRLK